LLKESEANLGGDFIREGLSAIISVKVLNPEFKRQTKTQLGNSIARRIVDQIVSDVNPFSAICDALDGMWMTRAPRGYLRWTC